MVYDSVTAAALAGLVISDKTKPGITREYVDLSENSDEKTFRWDYFLPNGKKITDEDRIDFLNKLVVPPAWTEVWFSPQENGHVQAIGKDARGRSQYRYHPDWTKIKSDLKFAGVDEFALSLSPLRERVKDDMKLKGMPLEKATAIVIRLMDLFHIRVGSDEYAKQNESYGLTTIKEGHVKFPRDGRNNAVFEFTGKSGKLWKLMIEDDELVQLLKESAKIGGRDKEQDLFMFTNDQGNAVDIKAEHINQYIDENTEEGEKFTAKNFRTWAASWKTGSRLAAVSNASKKDLQTLPKLFAEAEIASQDLGVPYPIEWKNLTLRGTENLVKLAEKNQLPGENEKQRQSTLLAIIDTVAADLGNTRSVCRSSYIRPMFIDDWESGVFEKRWKKASSLPLIPELNRDESTAVHYMRTHE